MVLSQGVGSSLHCRRVLLSDLLLVQVFVTLLPVTEKTRGYSEGVRPWMSFHLGVRSEGLAMTLPIHPVTHPSIFLQNYVLFLYQCPLASAVFFLCLVYTASFCLHPARSPLGAEKDSGCYNCIRARRFAVTSSFNEGVFNCILDARLDQRTTCM